MPSEQQVKDWYNKRYGDQGNDAMRPYEAYPLFMEKLKISESDRGKRFLDISCGTGYLLDVARKVGLKTYGIDISEKAVELARKVSPESEIVLGSGENLPFEDGQFDFVACIGSLEHFLDMNKGLFEMKRVGKKDAQYLIVVPNSKFLFDKSGTEQQDINENLMTLEEWTDLFNKNGFVVDSVSQDRWIMDRLKIFSSLNPLGIIKRVIYKYLLPLNRTYQFVFVLKKE